MGATAGRTTLNGEGLQHEDGHSQFLASTVPSIRAYDPAYAYELSTIIRDGIERMYGAGEDWLYYITLYNENYTMPPRPEGDDAARVQDGIIRGIYRLLPAPEMAGGARGTVRLAGSGALLQQAVAARDILAEKFGVAAEVYSVTSWQQLRVDGLEAERQNRLHPGGARRIPYVAQVLGPDGGPVILVSDWLKGLPDLLGRWLPPGYISLGTEGFGRSDTREALRALFEIDAANVALAALSALAGCGIVSASDVAAAIAALGIDPDKVSALAL
jgi:pyruvate dehydrogenase E1 component